MIESNRAPGDPRRICLLYRFELGTTFPPSVMPWNLREMVFAIRKAASSGRDELGGCVDKSYTVAVLTHL